MGTSFSQFTKTLSELFAQGFALELVLFNLVLLVYRHIESQSQPEPFLTLLYTTPGLAKFYSAHKLSSGFVESSCLIVKTTTQCHIATTLPC